MGKHVDPFDVFKIRSYRTNSIVGEVFVRREGVEPRLPVYLDLGVIMLKKFACHVYDEPTLYFFDSMDEVDDFLDSMDEVDDFLEKANLHVTYHNTYPES